MGKKKRKEPNTADLLAELATLDEVEASLPTDADQFAGNVPEWCELLLRTKRTGDHPINATWPLRRHDGELLIEVLTDVLHPKRRSVMSTERQLWLALDETVDRIQNRVAKGREPMKVDVGFARGLTTALATLANPADPDLETVRDEAMVRWESRTGA